MTNSQQIKAQNIMNCSKKSNLKEIGQHRNCSAYTILLSILESQLWTWEVRKWDALQYMFCGEKKVDGGCSPPNKKVLSNKESST